MKPVNNYTGYVLMVLKKREDVPPEISEVVKGRPLGTWETTEPMVIYPTVEGLIEATPDFDKKQHIIGQVTVHLLSERVEIISL